MKLIVVLTLLLVLFCAVGATSPMATYQADRRIADIAARSACARHNWRNRGRAPVGYIKGVAQVYAKSFCESRGSSETAVRVMNQPLQGNQDALVHYRDALRGSGVDVSSDIERLRALYTLGIGLGMRESSGNTTEGRDIQVRHPTASNAEAGLFQQSFDSLDSRVPALGQLLEQYRANVSACSLETFREGISRVVTRPVFGTGPGAEFQRFTRECPAFATEYAMVLLRVNREHFGPINRREAEFFQPCNDMLKEVEAVATCTP
jgi:hypothetical protein